MFHGPKPRVLEHGDVRIEVLHPGADGGNGLVRHCHFRVPRYLMSGGRAKSWSGSPSWNDRWWRYDAIGKPLWSEATGITELDDLGDGRTRVRFTETYHVFNPVMRVLLERRPSVHLEGQRHPDESRGRSRPGRPTPPFGGLTSKHENEQGSDPRTNRGLTPVRCQRRDWRSTRSSIWRSTRGSGMPPIEAQR
ncbi:MAG: hypothetical protein R2695_21050 [Acidimicrobiales bacterium]